MPRKRPQDELRPELPLATVRINLELSLATRERLEKLQKRTDARSMVEVISRALAVYETLVDEKERGSAIVVRRLGGKEVELLIVPL
jgi:hypothetical protein